MVDWLQAAAVASDRLITTMLRAARRRPQVAALLGLILTGTTRADDGLDFLFLVYGENEGRTDVLSPTFLYTKDLGRAGTVGLLLAYDSVSGASPTGEFPTGDTISSASSTTSTSNIPKAPFSDTRKAATLSYQRRFGDHLPSVELSYSRERDYSSTGIGFTDSIDLFGGQSTLRFGAGKSDAQVKLLATGEQFDNTRASAILGWTQIVGARDIVDVSLSYDKLDGFLSDPYKVVEVGGVLAPDQRPGTRARWSFIVKYGHAFFAQASLRTSYRYYRDDWGIVAHTLDARWAQRLGGRWIVTPRLRFHTQSSADFFAFFFDKPAAAMSGDYRLSSLNSWLAGVALSYAVSEQFSVSTAVTLLDQTGRDRVNPRITGTPEEERYELLENESAGGTIPSVSAADLQAVSLTLGLHYRF